MKINKEIIQINALKKWKINRLIIVSKILKKEIVLIVLK
jgi:hypothetical protein